MCSHDPHAPVLVLVPLAFVFWVHSFSPPLSWVLATPAHPQLPKTLFCIFCTVNVALWMCPIPPFCVLVGGACSRSLWWLLNNAAVNIRVQGVVQTGSFLLGRYFRVELLGLCQPC